MSTAPEDDARAGDGEHVIRLGFAGLPNRQHGDWDPQLPLPDELDVIELQLLEGPILDDHQHITDYSTISPEDDGSGTTCRYQSIADALTPGELARYRGRVTDFLERLIGRDESWILFCAGTPIKSEDVNHTDFFAGEIHSDHVHGNGAFTIVNARYRMRYFSELFGRCDAVAGLLAPKESFARVLGRLSLDAALPTSKRYQFASPYYLKDTLVLQRVLELGSLWFEEIDNGTRLRFVTRADQRRAWGDRICALICEYLDEEERAGEAVEGDREPAG